MRKYNYNPLVSQHVVEYDKFTNTLSKQRYCKRCGDKIYFEAPLYADECLACYENRGGGFSSGGWCGLAEHVNARWDLGDYIEMMIAYEYAIDCDYT